VALLSTADIGRMLGVETWRVQRLFEAGALPEPTRIAGRRVIASESLPAIVDALRARGWLPESLEASAHA
jgi:hypothetical protein